MRKPFFAVVISMPIIAYGLYWLCLAYWTSWSVPAETRIAIYSTEVNAAYYRGRGISSTPIGYFEPGDSVDVVWDTYGKDYWACYVRTSSGERGWILCTDLPPQTAGKVQT